jgi:hypothetical protein
MSHTRTSFGIWRPDQLVVPRRRLTLTVQVRGGGGVDPQLNTPGHSRSLRPSTTNQHIIGQTLAKGLFVSSPIQGFDG